jgi:hypothetical protein
VEKERVLRSRPFAKPRLACFFRTREVAAIEKQKLEVPAAGLWVRSPSLFVVPQPVAPAPPAQAPAARPSPPAAPPAPAPSSTPARSAAVAPAAAPAAPATGRELTAASFSTVGLNYERDLGGLFLGDFEHLRIGRSSMEFHALASNYLDVFARRCRAYLPPNKVEMTTSECAREQYTVNKYGLRVGGSTCIEWRTVGTGFYADPDLLAAVQQMEPALVGEAVKDLLGQSNRDPLAGTMRAADAKAAVGRDMQSLIAKNGCDSPGLQRFQANMLRFARNEPALRLAGGETIASTGPARPAPGTPFKDADYAKLLDDLIVEQSKAWMMNRYFRGSLSGVTVAARNADGRPLEIVAQYTVESVKGKTNGNVRLRFSDGLPQCMYFSDFPTTCRTPSPRIVTAYENNKYQQ